MSGKTIGFLALVVALLGAGSFSWSVQRSAQAADPLGMVSWESSIAPSESQVRADLEARRSGVSAAGVFPPDDRFEITETGGEVWRTITLLMLYDGSGTFLGDCSGVFIGGNVVLTAAHCLYEAGSYVGSVVAAPGATEAAPPFGLKAASVFAVPNGWADGPGMAEVGAPAELSQFDWGLVVFEGLPFGTSLAPYPFMAHAPDEFFAAQDTLIATAGFPGDKPFGSMWAAFSDEYFVDELFLYTRIDIFQGQSGSPIFAVDDDDFFIFSVVSLAGGIANLSVRFTPPVLEALKDYCADLGCFIKTYFWTPGELPTATAPPTATPTQTPTASPSPSPAPSNTPPVQRGQYRVSAPLLSRD